MRVAWCRRFLAHNLELTASVAGCLRVTPCEIFGNRGAFRYSYMSVDVKRSVMMRIERGHGSQEGS
jgi:hypothetical protein